MNKKANTKKIRMHHLRMFERDKKEITLYSCLNVVDVDRSFVCIYADVNDYRAVFFLM